MKEQDLMVGNWFHHKAEWSTLQGYENLEEFDFEWTVDNWYQVGECLLSLEVVDGILLTEEWLIKFGFSSHDRNTTDCDWTIADPNNPVMRLNKFQLLQPDYDEAIFFFEMSIIWHILLQYVHELQNLYYSLTKTEL